MADEFEILSNPTNTPGTVSTGYQRQNTNSEAARNGIELSNVLPVTSVNQITIDLGGGVDVNGVMYTAKTVLTLSVSSGTYYIKLTAGSTTDYLTPVLQTSRGTYDESKNGYYDSGERVLDWAIVSDGSTYATVKRLVDGKSYPSSGEYFTGDYYNGSPIYAKRYTGTLPSSSTSAGGGYFWQTTDSFDGTYTLLNVIGALTSSGLSIRFVANSGGSPLTVGNAYRVSQDITGSTIVHSGESNSSSVWNNATYDIVILFIK